MKGDNMNTYTIAVLNDIIKEHGDSCTIYTVDDSMTHIIYSVVEESHLFIYEQRGGRKIELFAYALD